MNTLKDYVTTHLQLISVDVLEFVILQPNIYVTGKIEDLNLSMCNMITGINKSKTLTKLITCEYKCKSDGRKCNANQKWSNDNCWCMC